MRLRERDKRDLTLRLPLRSEDVYRWEAEGIAIRAMVQPLGYVLRKLMVNTYGDRVERMLSMYYDGAYGLQDGAGICLEVGPEDSCDYRIIGVDRWPGHQQAILEYIPPARRG